MLKCSNESIWHYCLFNSVPSLQPVNVPCHALILNLNNTISENITDFTIELRKKAEKVGFSWNKGENRWYWNPSSQCVKGTRLNKFGCICDGICFEKCFVLIAPCFCLQLENFLCLWVDIFVCFELFYHYLFLVLLNSVDSSLCTTYLFFVL